MIKILQVVGRMHRAGMETLIMNIYRNIDRSKIQFDFCVHYPEPGDYDDEIAALGGRIYQMPCPSYMNLWKIKKSVEHFFEEHNDYAAVHVHFICFGFFYYDAAKRAGINNLIYHAHNDSRINGVRPMIRFWLEQYSFNKAGIYFACSKRSAEYHSKRKVFRIINNGIDTREFAFQPDIRQKIRKKMDLEGKKVCIHVARFSEVKNQRFAIAAFDMAQKEDPRLELLLAGDGPLLEECKKFAAKLQSREHIHFLGISSDVGGLMNASDIFLLPSFHEGLPLTLIEAQTSGMKCIISDKITTDACIIKDRVTYLSITDVSEWARVIMENTCEGRADFSDKIREAGFDCLQTGKEMEDFYLSIEKGNGLSAGNKYR